jgi:DNA-binding MarR family transcriptional regulator
MGRLRDEIHKSRAFDTLEQEATLNLLRTADALARQADAVLRTAGISATQYNVLRILGGARESLSCGEIAQRMITRDPDMTRLLDRLERRGLIERCRGEQDRRVVHSRITEAGLKILGELEEPVRQLHRKQLGHMGAERLRALIDLLEHARAGTPNER